MAKRKPDAPSIEYIQDLRTEVEKEFAAQDAQIDRMREVRMQTSPVPLDKRMRLVDWEYHDATITDEVWRVGATLSVNRPTMTVVPTRIGEAAEDNGTLREKWTEETLWRSGRRKSGPHTFNAAMDSVVGDGGGWTKLLWNKDVWEKRYKVNPKDYPALDGQTAEQRYNKATEDAKMALPPPFSWLHVDARSVYPVWSGDDLVEVLEIQKRPLHSTLHQYGMRLNDRLDIVPDDLGEGTNVRDHLPDGIDWLEHWTRDYCSYYLVGQNLRGDPTSSRIAQWKHGYGLGHPPYHYAPGLTPNWMKNRKVGLGVGAGKLFLVEYRSYLRTLYAQVVARDTLTPLKLLRNPAMSMGNLAATGNDRKPKKPRRWQLGLIYEDLLPGEDLVPLQMPDVARALQAEIALVSQEITKLESPRIDPNIGAGVEGAGFSIYQLLSEGKLRHDPLSQGMTGMLTDLTYDLWQMMQTKVKEKVYVYVGSAKKGAVGMLGAGAKDVTPDVLVKWELNIEQPSAELVKQRAVHERLAAGTLDWTEGVTRLGDNPDEVRRGLLIDSIRKSPEYQDLFKGHVLQTIGRGDLVAQAARAQQIVQSGQVGGLATSPIAGAVGAMNQQAREVGVQTRGVPRIGGAGQLSSELSGGGIPAE